MTATSTAPLEWLQFAAAFAELIDDPRELRPETRVRDLGLDSLALVELHVLLMERYQTPELSPKLDAEIWEGMTLGSLFRQCRSTTRLPGGSASSITSAPRSGFTA